MRSSGIAVCILAYLLAGPAAGARAAEALVRPPSFDHPELLPLPRVDVWSAPPVDVVRLLREDAANADVPGLPARVGFPMRVDVDPSLAGTWEALPGGDRLWRVRVHSAGARWIVLGFGTYRLQPGGRLYVYPEDSSTVLGHWTAVDVRRHGQLWLPPVEGDTVVVELFWPRELAAVQPRLRLGTVSHGYKGWAGSGMRLGDPDWRGDERDVLVSGACNDDVNCPLGSDWQDEKRGVARLLIGGSTLCTGSLINNTANDSRPYALTARHCVSTQTEAASTTFLFNYERPGCNSGSPPTGHSLTGSQLVASYADSDFALLEIGQQLPGEWNLYFNGWTRGTSPAGQSWCIHHPQGDVKKIAFNDDTLVDGSQWGSDHWRVTQWEDGTTEAGSSGSPMFNGNHRIVGQLHGGTSSCTNDSWDEFGKFSVSWGGGGSPTSRLRNWLDPGGTGVTSLDGIYGVNASRLDYLDHTFDDFQANGNGWAEPGETLMLAPRLGNSGNRTATGVGGVLSSPTIGVGVVDGQATWPAIPMGSSAASDPPHFKLQIDPSVGCGEAIGVHLQVTASGEPAIWASDIEFIAGVPTFAQPFTDEMETGANGWTVQTSAGANPWAQSTLLSHSFSHSWHVEDVATTSESRLLMPVRVALAPGSSLRFWHYMVSETTYDGGVLEYSTNGTFWNDAGELITTGGYNSSIHSQAASPLAGRDAWSGDLGGWQLVAVDLGSLAGSDVYLRWRFATDNQTSAEGWFVDDVAVYELSYECDPGFVVPPGEASAPGTAPFTLGRAGGAFVLSWSPPVNGGHVDDYALYSVPLSGPVGAPSCEGGLGMATWITRPDLPDGRGFIVVARNASGEGSYGQDGDGAERPRAEGAAVCP